MEKVRQDVRIAERLVHTRTHTHAHTLTHGHKHPHTRAQWRQLTWKFPSKKWTRTMIFLRLCVYICSVDEGGLLRWPVERMTVARQYCCGCCCVLNYEHTYVHNHKVHTYIHTHVRMYTHTLDDLQQRIELLHRCSPLIGSSNALCFQINKI